MAVKKEKTVSYVVDTPELKLTLSELESTDFHVLNVYAELTDNYFKGFQKASKSEKIELIRYGKDSARGKAIRESLAEKERESSGRQAEGLRKYRESLNASLAEKRALLAKKAEREKKEATKKTTSKKKTSA